MPNSQFVPTEEKFEKYQIINNKPYAVYLTTFLKTKAEDGYVLNLNAEWGAGKTTFLQCWYNELKENHPVVYFDAWKSDFTKDPMLALMDAFHQQLISPISENKELIRKLISYGSHFIKTSLPHLVVGYVKTQTGMNEDESLIESASEEFGIPQENLSDALKDTIRSMLNQKNRVEGIDDFKKLLVELSENYITSFPNVSSPIFVLIDELDRCRPTYAIETIECIKHFFNTKNIVFILATDTGQLKHSIKSIYGEGFNSIGYLSRFFNNTITLPTPDKSIYIKNKLTDIKMKTTDNLEIILEVIVKLFELHNILSIREIDKILSIVIFSQSTNEGYKTLSLITMLILKHRHLGYYENFKYDKTHNPYYYEKKYKNEKNIKILKETYLHIGDDRIDMQIVANQLLKVEDSKDSYDQIEISKKFNYKESFIRKICALNDESAIKTSNESSSPTLEKYLEVIDFSGYFER